jgi:hypothetical protein
MRALPFRHRHVRSSATAVMLLAVLGTSAHAQNFFDDFNANDDSAYQRFQPLSAFGAGGTFTFSNGGYRIQGPASPAPVQLGVQRLAAAPVGVAVTDFSMSVDIIDWNTSNLTGIGLFARTRQLGLGTTDGYYVHLNIGGGSSAQLIIDRIDNEVTSLITLGGVLNLSQSEDYRLTFTGVGDQFSASLFSLNDLTTPLSTLSGVDATYSSGGVGFGTTALLNLNTGQFINNPLDATFDNFRVVPTPGAAAILGLGGLLVARRRR